MISQQEEKSSIKFIHASDIHLGCQQHQNVYRSDDFIRIFQEILDLAKKYEVDFVLLGGDVFTSVDILPEKLIKIVSILKNFKEDTKGKVYVIAIEGNHDFRKRSRGRNVINNQSWLQFLAGLELIVLLDANMDAPTEQIFQPYDSKSQKGGKIQIKNAIIYGNRYIGSKAKNYFLKIREAIAKDDGLFHVLLQHFGIKGQMKNVPGINLKFIEPLKDRVDYLALGHYHLQYILDGWIYNPGCSEAACSIDFSYKRGVFLVEVQGEKKLNKKIIPIRLNTRKYLWRKIVFSKCIMSKKGLIDLVLRELRSSLDFLRTDLKRNDPQMPVLFVLLKGIKPNKNCKSYERELKKRICENFPVVDVRIYQKFADSINTIYKYL